MFWQPFMTMRTRRQATRAPRSLRIADPREEAETADGGGEAEADSRAPSALLMLLESRAPWEWAASIAALPWLAQAPRGDAHPVLVLPGLAAGDATTVALRQYIAALGYAAYPWDLGLNFGPRAGVIEQCRALVRELHARHGERVSLIGWSLGGVFARELAKEMPRATRCVITLGAPFAGHPRATNAWRLYRMVSGHDPVSDQSFATLREPPPAPTTSLYSRSDGIVSWRCSVNPQRPQAENIEIVASHLGLGMHPLALYAIADRLAQPIDGWQPFAIEGARRWFFKGNGAGT